MRVARVARVQPVQPAEELEVGRRRQLVVQPRRLGQDADPGADGLGLIDDVQSVDGCAALRRCDQRREHPDRRGLARAVGSEEPEHLATVHLEVHATDRPELPE